MDIKVNELKYNNKIKGCFEDISINGNNSKITVKFKNNDLDGEIDLSFDEIRNLWAKLLEFDESKSKEVKDTFNDNLLEANNIANRLSSDAYDDLKIKLDDMKNFAKIYSELIEHAKFGLSTKKDLEKKQQDLIHEQSKLEEIKEKEEKFDDEAIEMSKQFEDKFPRESLSGNAIELDELMKKQEIEQKKIKEEEAKRLAKLKEEAKAVKAEPEFSKPQMTGDVVDVHVDSDYKKVDPLFEENKGMQKFSKRSSDLDKIDFSKL